MKKLRVGIYGRVSTRDQAVNGYSIDMQKKKGEEYLKFYQIEVESIEFFIDGGKTGRNTNRKRFQEMMRMVRNKELDLIIVYKLDRLSRSIIDIYETLQTCLDFDVNLVSILDNVNIQTANGRFVVGVLALVAQLELEQASERSEDALYEMLDGGMFPLGYTPLGYKKKNNYLLVDNKKSKIVREIYTAVGEGVPLYKVAIEIKKKI